MSQTVNNFPITLLSPSDLTSVSPINTDSVFIIRNGTVNIGSVANLVANSVSLAIVVPVSGPITIDNTYQGKIIQVTGAQTLTIGTLTSAFQYCTIIQIDSNQSTIAGTFIGDFGSTHTQAVAGSRTFLQRVSSGIVYFKGQVG